MASDDAVARPRKHNHVETILYEIDMLEYCYGRLVNKKLADQKEANLCIEGFLLHYRNLIQFFGNDQGLQAGDQQAWSPRRLSPEELGSIQNRKPFEDYSGPISRWLSHCTEIRAKEDIKWKHVKMFDEIKPLVDNFRKLFPPEYHPPSVALASPEVDASTATITSYGFNSYLESAVPPKAKKKELSEGS